MSQIDELRHIIVGDNSEQLAELKDRIEDVSKRTNDVAEVLSPAIAKEGDSLAASLQKPVSLGLKRAIRAEPEEYAEILYPVMAPSIRRAIAQAISSMMVTINRTVESATTVQGLSMRYESLRTGVPYAELTLRNTLLYRVEHLYFIDRDSGMAIANVHAYDTDTLDSDAVSAMFSAIQSFVQDSFSQSEGGRLTDLKVGEHNVWVAHGARGMLACVIRGDAPESLKNELYDTLDYIRSRYANAIVDFDGDASSFEGVHDLLRPLLQSELKDKKKDKERVEAKKQSLGALVITIALIGFALYLLVQWLIGKSHISTVEHFLRETPGVAATDLYWRNGKLVVEGLKDPDAVLPYSTFRAYGIETEDLQFNMTPFRSLEVNMELQRFSSELDLPEGLSLSAVDGSIELVGEAPLRWLNNNNIRLRQLAADRRLSIKEMAASPESVLRMLRASFPSADLDEARLFKIKGEGHTVIYIGGRIDASSLRVIRTVLAGNDWVKIQATAK